jgi:5-methylcytosine-specific restriction endonuclease McrA
MPGCVENSNPGNSRCPTHTPAGGWDNARYKAKPGWKQKRRMTLRRDGSQCVICGNAAEQVDHLLPVRWGGADVLVNLQSVCARCHRLKTQDEQQIGRHRTPGAVAAHVKKWRGVNA